MKSQKISEEEQKAINEINLKESGIKEPSSEESKVSQKEDAPKKQKSKREVVAHGYTDGGGNFIPIEGDEVPEVYKERVKKMKPYKRFSDGAIEF